MKLVLSSALTLLFVSQIAFAERSQKCNDEFQNAHVLMDELAKVSGLRVNLYASECVNDAPTCKTEDLETSVRWDRVALKEWNVKNSTGPSIYELSLTLKKVLADQTQLIKDGCTLGYGQENTKESDSIMDQAYQALLQKTLDSIKIPTSVLLFGISDIKVITGYPNRH